MILRILLPHSSKLPDSCKWCYGWWLKTPPIRRSLRISLLPTFSWSSRAQTLVDILILLIFLMLLISRFLVHKSFRLIFQALGILQIFLILLIIFTFPIFLILLIHSSVSQNYRGNLDVPIIFCFNLLDSDKSDAGFFLIHTKQKKFLWFSVTSVLFDYMDILLIILIHSSDYPDSRISSKASASTFSFIPTDLSDALFLLICIFSGLLVSLILLVLGLFWIYQFSQIFWYPWFYSNLIRIAFQIFLFYSGSDLYCLNFYLSLILLLAFLLS